MRYGRLLSSDPVLLFQDPQIRVETVFLIGADCRRRVRQTLRMPFFF